MTNWQTATCEKCMFRVGPVCRRFPPNNKDYPYVASKDEGRPIAYDDACAEYAEEGQVSQVVRNACKQILREPVFSDE